MAQVTNTFVSTSSNTNREELSDVVDRITPEDTPIYSLIAKTSFKTTHPEWGTDELEEPEDNAQLEGDDYDFDGITPPDRYGNHTQIFRRTGILSETQEKMDEAGNVLKVKKQVAKKGIAARKDVEFSILSFNASVGGATRKSGSLASWIESNASRGTNGANGGFNSTTGLTVAPTNGDQRAFTKTLLDNVMQQGYQSGANFRHCIVSPYVKSVFVTFMSDSNVASFRYAASNGTNNSIVANADVYEGPFGKVMIHPNRVMSEMASKTTGAVNATRNAFLIDTEYLEWGWFRKIARDKDVAKTGDARKFVVIGEGSLKPKNEKGLGVIADLYGLTAST